MLLNISFSRREGYPSEKRMIDLHVDRRIVRPAVEGVSKFHHEILEKGLSEPPAVEPAPMLPMHRHVPERAAPPPLDELADSRSVPGTVCPRV
ncbi:hypothetical protein [Sinorhizobium meliloti]|uniref:hypothetical protein n=1 Tax=Rhizobium meliloti TaxID=382 RepID=UPI000FD6F37F|nr:hypothetical protein [Sinorhizobium meliloti]RVM00681.1 hypothetical protein CN134_36990 [Sinorhizobium meliloti]RVO18841.1 hypothetical protein CN098_37175 [Sinorhizobium meliloti]RVO46404.1 hypothetical protein CN092_34585 [Sinorhizobium meliloti]